MTEARTVITTVLKELIAHRGTGEREITGASALTADLDLDSLELAELSSELEDRLGRDPYSEGIVPVTVNELAAFYA